MGETLSAHFSQVEPCPVKEEVAGGTKGTEALDNLEAQKKAQGGGGEK